MLELCWCPNIYGPDCIENNNDRKHIASLIFIDFTFSIVWSSVSGKILRSAVFVLNSLKGHILSFSSGSVHVWNTRPGCLHKCSNLFMCVSVNSSSFYVKNDSASHVAKPWVCVNVTVSVCVCVQGEKETEISHLCAFCMNAFGSESFWPISNYLMKSANKRSPTGV